MDTVRWLLVGAGDVARKRVAAALRAVPGSTLAAVCDVVRESAQALAAEHGAAQVFTDLDVALAQADADAVYVATPVHLHAAHAVQALESGRHVLVEKPLGLDGAACQQAVAAAAAAAPRLAGCAYYRRLYPAFAQVQHMLAAGEFGDVVLGRMVYHSWFAPAADDPKAWRVVRARAGGGPLSDMGTHMIDLVIGLLGMPLRVQAACRNQVHRWDVEDTAVCCLEMANGALVTGAFSWASRTWRHEFELVGSQAKVYWHPYDSGHVVRTVGRDVAELDLPPAANVHVPLVADFVEAVRAGREPVCPLATAARTNLVLDAIYRAAATRTEVAL